MSSNVPASLPTYRLRRAFHLGDRWARLNYALRLLEAGEEFQLSLPDSSAHEILEALQLDGLRERLQFGPPSSDEPSRELSRRIDRGAAAYNCRYFPTRQLHASPAQAIGYTFEANWRREEKIPPITEALLSDLQTALPGWQLMPMGKP